MKERGRYALKCSLLGEARIPGQRCINNHHICSFLLQSLPPTTTGCKTSSLLCSLIHLYALRLSIKAFSLTTYLYAVAFYPLDGVAILALLDIGLCSDLLTFGLQQA
jgi:hypothetical protein